MTTHPRHELTVFDGPLDLLLSLVEREKLSLSDVSLAHVTETFLREVRARAMDDRYPPEALAQFLVVASQLVAKKARLLVPTDEALEEAEETLVARLEAYQQYVRAGAWLAEHWQGTPRFYGRGEQESFLPEPLPLAPSLDCFHEALCRLLHAQEEVVASPKPLLLEKLINLEERIAHLKEVVRARGTMFFSQWMSEHASREERLVSFLAVLELVRMNELHVKQDDLFSDILLSL